jgi:hypothetical protein
MIDEAKKTEQPLVERGTVLPLGTYEDGTTSFAWPGLIAAPFEGMANFGRYGYDSPEAIADNARSAFDVAGGAMTGGLGVGLAGGMADNALGSAGAKITGNALERSNVRPPSGPWPETATFDDRLGAVRQTFENPNELYRLPLPWNKAAREDRLPYNHSDLIDGKEATTKEVQIRDLLSFQNNAVRDDVRALTNPDIRAGAGEPTVVRYKGNDQIVDGHHRLLADLLNGNDAATVRYIDTLLANGPTGSSVPLALNALERSQPQGIRAYHGSPHDFDRFSLDMIGTGEGAQAYGHGLYFADSEDVARRYRDTLSDYKDAVIWKGEQQPTPMQQSLLNRLGGADVRAGVAMDVPRLRVEIARSIRDAEHGMFPNPEQAAKYRAELEELKRIEPLIETKPPGRMYEVNIKANPEDFLDWDKPLSQQSEAVRNVLAPEVNRLWQERETQRQNTYASLVRKGSKNSADKYMGSPVPRDETELMQSVINAGTEREKAISQALREAGIPGIRYLDGMSRDGGAGTSNYVVFDDQLVDILRKYANAPTGSAIPAGMEASQQKTDYPFDLYPPIRPLP